MGRAESMTDDEAYNFAETLRTDQHLTALRLDGPEWTSLGDISGDVFDLENDGKPLWFYLDANGVHYVQVTFNPPLSQFSAPVPSQYEHARSSTRSSDPSRSSGPLHSSDPSRLTSDPLRSTSDPSRPLTQIYEDYSSPVIIFRRRVYVAKFNVHVGKSVLRRFYVIGFIDETTS